MFGYSPSFLAIGALWVAACAGAGIIVLARTRRTPRNAAAAAWVTLNGLFLVGLSPIVAAIGSYFAKRLELWNGAGVLVVGLAMILFGQILRARRERSKAGAQATTFREMSLFVQIASTLLVYGYFGLHLGSQALTPLGAISALIGITASMIAINVAAHIAIALYIGVEPVDERDQEIALRGTRNGYQMLGAAWFAVLLLVIAQAPYAWLFLALLAAFGFAEIVRYGSMLAYYRLGL